MKILKIADIELKASEDNTLKTEEVAKFYGTSDSTIRSHLQNHSDELIKNQHYIIKKNHLNKPAIYWTLEGVYMLGFFIKSERAKKYRKAVAKLLKEIKKGNVTIQPQPNILGEYDERIITELIKRSDVVRGYQGMITRLENELALKQSELKNKELKAQLIISNVKEMIQDKLHNIERKFITFQKEIQDDINYINAIFEKPIREDKNFIYIGKAMIPKNNKF